MRGANLLKTSLETINIPMVKSIVYKCLVILTYLVDILINDSINCFFFFNWLKPNNNEKTNNINNISFTYNGKLFK